MAECYRCGVSDERERLFSAISNKGVVKICRNCAEEEGLPVVQPVDVEKPEKSRSVYERLSDMAKLDPEKHRTMLLEKARQDSMKKYKQDREKRTEMTLKGVIDRNFEKNRPQPRNDLVNNFHWLIMRARRSKKLTQKQLAEDLGEQESVIRDAEAGIILSSSDALVKKLESYLGIKLRKIESAYSQESSNFTKPGISEDPERKEIRERFEKERRFDSRTAENLTIADLQEMDKKKQEEGSSNKGFFSFLRRKKKDKEEEMPEEEEDEEDRAGAFD